MAYYRLPRFPNAHDYERAADYYKKHGDSTAMLLLLFGGVQKGNARHSPIP